MDQIQVSVRGDDQIEVQIHPEGADSAVTLMLSKRASQELGAALLGMSQTPDPGTSLFAQQPAMMVQNPPMEVQIADTRQIWFAFLPDRMRPILLKLSPDLARWLRDRLTACLGKDSL